MRPAFALACLAALAALSGCKPTKATRPDGGWDGRAVFSQTCAPCHGLSGKGDTQQGRAVGAKDLTRDEVKQMSDLAIVHQIRMGKGKMPGFGDVLDWEEVEALVKYVRTLSSAP